MNKTTKLFRRQTDAKNFIEVIEELCMMYGVKPVFDYDSYRETNGDYQEVLRVKVLPADRPKGGKKRGTS